MWSVMAKQTAQAENVYTGILDWKIKTDYISIDSFFL